LYKGKDNQEFCMSRAKRNKHPITRRAYCAALLTLVSLVFIGRTNCDPVQDFVNAARVQIGKTVSYDPRYRVLTYPNGDIPMDRGVCSDVVIRAMRASLHLDLQKLVHEDMRSNFSEYPRRWGLTQPDKNIDHRRVPNLRTYFERSGWALEISDAAGDYLAGDIVTCTVPPHRPHVMIVSDKKNRGGIPLVIHNIGAGVQEEDRLFEFEITGHYRLSGFEPADSL
jgi:uncharacterized protein YijF (DUF1287 family)